MSTSALEELRWIEDELARVNRARAWLVDRRMTLLAELARPNAANAVAPPAGPNVAEFPAASGARAPAEPKAARPELSGRAVARILLVVGALLVVIAAAVFTVANWSSIGTFGRCGVLLGATAVVLVAPKLLTRRDLVATAEAVATIGLALTLADAYLIARLLNVPGHGLLTAVGYAAIAVAWVGYGWSTRLRVPVIAGIAMAQVPALLVTADLAGRPPAGPLAVVLMLTAGADLMLARALADRVRRAEVLASSILAAVAWAIGVGLAAEQAVAAPGQWPWQATSFIAAAVVGIALGPRNQAFSPVAILSGVLLSIGLALPIATVGRLQVVAFAVAGAAVIAGGLWWGRGASRRDSVGRLGLVAAGAAAVLGVTALFVLPSAVQALTGSVPARSASGLVRAGAAGVGGLSGWPVVIVLGLAGLACLAWPAFDGSAAASRDWVRAVAAPFGALTFGALAVASMPVALGATNWARLGILDLAVSALVGLAAAPVGRWARSEVVVTAGLSAVALAASAILVPLVTSPGANAAFGGATTIIELLTLAAVFAAAATFARNTTTAAISTAAGLAATATLAFAASAAAGVPANQTGFAALGVAVLAIIGSTYLSKKRPVEGMVLDLGAGLIVVTAALVATLHAQAHADAFAATAAIGAILASSTAWVRRGARRTIALVSAGCAAIAALAVQWQPLTQAWFGNIRPWNGHPLAGTAQAGLPYATCVLALSLAAIISGVGAWRGERRGSLDALAIALPSLIVPGSLAGGLAYPVVLGGLLALALGLTIYAAINGSLAPVSAAVVATVAALAWALASPAATITTLACLATCYVILAWRSSARVATAALAVFATAALASATTLAAGQPTWLAGIAAMAIAAAAHLTAARLTSRLPLTAMAIEGAAWVAAAIGTALCLNHLATASLALAFVGLQLLATVARPGNARRGPALWLGLIALQTAWCLLLATLGVTTVEPYTIPAAAIALAFTWRAAVTNSWAATPGLALLLLPSLIVTWQTHGWIRPTALGIAAAAVTLAGARLSQKAPLLIGATIVALDAGDQLAPDVRRLAELLPGWVPFAVIGAVLLWVGATYEARLRNLTKLRRSLANLH